MSTRQPGDNQNEQSAPPSAQATHSTSKAVLTVGSVYTGTIKERSKDGSYTVELTAPNEVVGSVLAAAPVFGGLMGFNVRGRLSIGTKVAMFYGTPSFIYSVIPPTTEDGKYGHNRAMIWGDDVLDAPEGETFNDAPIDMVPGEFEIANLFGVAMQFLTNLMRLTAGDRAAVEVHLINDMVRIISAQYRHISGIGEDLIFDHGRPTMERSWSSYRHELMNQLEESKPYADLSGDAVDASKLTDDQMLIAGRHRLIEFIGFAGDFIHSFITDPAEVAASTLADMASGAGKSWIHRNSDGSVIVQSVADIRLERVCRIPVPVRNASHEDPSKTKEREYSKLDADFLKLPDFGSLDKKNAYRMAYHLRSYSRWLSRYHAFARVHQLGATDYALKGENESPKPSWTNREADRDVAAPGVDYYDSYACISIMRDGSIIMHDGYGSTVAMSNGNVQVSASRHLDLEAAGDIRVVAGGSLLVKVRRNVEVSASIGGIVIHSYAFIRGLCEKGSVWLRSLLDKDATSPAEPKEEGGPEPEVINIAGINRGVVLESSSGTAIRANQQLMLSAEGDPELSEGETDDRTSSNADVVIQTKGNLRVKSSNTLIKADRTALVSADETLTVSTPCVYGRISEFSVPGSFMLSNGSLHVRELRASVITGVTITGKKVGPTADPADPSSFSNPVGKHFNHILTLPDSATVTVPEAQNEAGNNALQFIADNMRGSGYVTMLSEQDGAVWNFLPDSEYYWDSREDAKGALVETLTQQYLRLDNESGKDLWGGAGYAEWSWGSSKVDGTRIGISGGFGTKCVVYRSDDPSGNDLRSPSATPTGVPTLSWSAQTSVNFKYLNR